MLQSVNKLDYNANMLFRTFHLVKSRNSSTYSKDVEGSQ